MHWPGASKSGLSISTKLQQARFKCTKDKMKSFRYSYTNPFLFSRSPSASFVPSHHLTCFFLCHRGRLFITTQSYEHQQPTMLRKSSFQVFITLSPPWNFLGSLRDRPLPLPRIDRQSFRERTSAHFLSPFVPRAGCIPVLLVGTGRVQIVPWRSVLRSYWKIPCSD